MKLPPIIPAPEQALEDLKPIIGRLISAFEFATAEARATAEEKGYDGHYYSHQVRYEAKIDLRRNGIDAEDCELEDTPNTGICISLADYFVRVLRSQDGEVPDPGESEKRKRFLKQEPESQQRFDFAFEPEPDEIQEQEPTHIILLWEDDHDRFFTGFWLICPAGVGEYHFKVWIARPEISAGFIPPTAPPSGPPPDELEGIERKQDIEIRKTGSDDSAK